MTAYIRQVYDDLDMKRVAAGLPTSQVTYWKGTYDFVMRFCYASGDGANLDETILNAYQAQIGMNRAVDNLGVGVLRP